MGNRIKTGVAYVVKLLPIAIELIEKYRGLNERKTSPDCVFPVGEYQAMLGSLKYIGKKCGCKVEVTPHIGRHTFAVLAILKGMPLETLQKVLGHNSILSTQIYAELINRKSAKILINCVRESAMSSSSPCSMTTKRSVPQAIARRTLLLSLYFLNRLKSL